MERIFWSLLFSLITSTMLGCVQTSFTATGRTYEPWDGPVKIFQVPPKNIKYEELGWVSGQTDDDNYDWVQILGAMQEEARKRGANAIILVSKESSTQSSSTQSEVRGNLYESKKKKDKKRNMVAIAIRIQK